MNPDREALRRLQAALRSSDVDAAGLVSEAYEAAEAEVRATLERAFAHDLLARVIDVLESGRGPMRVAAVADEEPMPATTEAGPVEPTESEVPAQQGEEQGTSRAAEVPRSGTYVFGVTWQDRPGPDPMLARLPAGGPLRHVEHAGLRGVVCDVDPQALTDIGEDEEALLATATAHDAVLANTAQHGPVVPLRMGTVVADDLAVQAFLDRHEQALEQELSRFDGLSEWAVTVTFRDPTPTAPDDLSVGAVEGNGYLAQRRSALQTRRFGQQERARIAADVHDRICRLARAATTVTRSLGHRSGRLHHGVYLLDDGDLEAFHDLVRALEADHPHTVIESRGPWPAYHFSTVTFDDEVEHGQH